MTKVVIEVRGGNVVECYSDNHELEICIIDWDNIDAGGEAAKIAVASLWEVPRDTRKALEYGYTG